MLPNTLNDTDMRKEVFILPKVKICESHKPMEKTYLGWFMEVEKRYRAGKKQSQCPTCKRWFFKDEM